MEASPPVDAVAVVVAGFVVICPLARASHNLGRRQVGDSRASTAEDMADQDVVTTASAAAWDLVFERKADLVDSGGVEGALAFVVVGIGVLGLVVLGLGVVWIGSTPAAEELIASGKNSAEARTASRLLRSHFHMDSA